MGLNVFEGGLVEESGECEGGDLLPFFYVVCLEVFDYVVALVEGELGGCVFFDGDLLEVFFEGLEFGFDDALGCYFA